ncbi:MAG: hypothetical protein M0003_09870 [Acidithiobacillus sp.]|nr:hypothetical protein [Acidithiobacillus sp.]
MITVKSAAGTPWNKATSGHRSIRFIISDSGELPQPNDRYTVIFDEPISIRGSHRGTTYPYLSMNHLGMGYHGEVDPAYVEALIRGDIKGDRLLRWGNLNQDCRNTLLAELQAYLERELDMAG